MDVLLVLLLIGAAVYLYQRQAAASRQRALEERQATDVAAVRRVAEEDVTRFGEELARLDTEVLTTSLDEAARQDYQRALDSYESAKESLELVRRPDEIKHVTEALEDGRYAAACVMARAENRPLPTRRPPCFFDPRHGLSVADVPWTPPGGAVRDVPACALDVERVRAGAEPDIRTVMVGPRRVPYWQGGRAYQPYAAGYFGAFSPMDWMFAGLLFSGLGGFDALGGIGEGIGEGIAGLGEGIGDGFAGLGEGLGDLFDGFDF
jgi:hypothetical protein